MTTEHAVSAHPDGYYQVVSARSRKVYRVMPSVTGLWALCECESWRHRKRCSHVDAVIAFAAKVLKDGEAIQSLAPVHPEDADALQGAALVPCSARLPTRPAGLPAAVLPSLLSTSETSTSPARRGDMTRDRANHTTAYAAASGDEHPEAVGSSAPRDAGGNKLGGSRLRSRPIQPPATVHRRADYEAIGSEGVGSPGGGPGAGDVDVAEILGLADREIAEYAGISPRGGTR